jgi:endonuclease III
MVICKPWSIAAKEKINKIEVLLEFTKSKVQIYISKYGYAEEKANKMMPLLSM